MPTITHNKRGLRTKTIKSRAKVMEHVERFYAHLEKYIDNKGLVAAHFHQMARAWYRATHLSNNMVEATQFPIFLEVK